MAPMTKPHRPRPSHRMVIKHSLETTIYLNQDKDKKPFFSLKRIHLPKRDPKKEYRKDEVVEKSRYHGEVSWGVYRIHASAMAWWLDSAKASVSSNGKDTAPGIHMEVDGGGSVQNTKRRSLHKVSSSAERMGLLGPIAEVPEGRVLPCRRERLVKLLRFW